LQAAEGAFQQALEIYPYSVTAYYGLGFVALFRQDFPTAIAIFKESLALQPTAEAYVNLGGAYLGAGEYEKAREMLEASLYIKSTGAARSFLTRLAQIQGESGE
jgi:tetratricopeptide (TPR) repeat protein